MLRTLPPPQFGGRVAHRAIARRRPAVLLTAAGTLCLGYGLVVIIAWPTHTRGVLDWLTRDGPVVLTSALVFVVTGAAFIALGWGRGHLAAIVAAGDVVIGLLALTEHALDRGLGIDEFVMTAYVSEPGAPPGRMAVNTAVCSVLIGAALMVAGLAREPLVGIVLATAGSLVAAIAGLALYGYAADEAGGYRWALPAMPPPEAVTLLIIAATMVGMAWRLSRWQRAWLVVPAGALVLGVGTLTWLALANRGGTDGAVATAVVVILAVLVTALMTLVLTTALRAERDRLLAVEEAARRAAVEDALRASEADLSEVASYARSLIEASLDPLVTISADGKITDVNESTIRATGVAREQLVGTDFSEYFTDPARARAGYQQVFAEGQVTDYPLTIRHKSGLLTEVLYNASLYRDTAGRVQGVFAAARNITAQRRAEEEAARRAEELEAANRELGRSNADLEQFAYVASHDLREPLRAIAGPLTYIAEHYRGRLDAQADEFIEFAVDGSERMNNLIDGLLAFSRVGRMEGAMVSVQADEIARRALMALGPALASAAAEVTVDPLPEVFAEPNQLTEVLQNLIGNAAKFVAPGTRPCIHVYAERLATAWRFNVVDNGIGIPLQHRERVFTMFKRLHSPEQYAGTGIGLAVVKKIVERHGGQIGVDDAPTGTGCRFWFTLPAA